MVFFYVLFLQTGACSPLKRKQNKENSKLMQASAWVHTHMLSMGVWQDEISGDTVPDWWLSITKN